MKLAFCVEDDTDEEIAAKLLGRLLSSGVEASREQYRFPRGGWANALKLAPIVARAAFNSGLDGAVFVVDNDGASPHLTEHGRAPDPDCRLCGLRAAAQVEEVLGWSRPALPPLRFLFAVPVQTIETWLLLIKGHAFNGTEDALGAEAAGRRTLKRLLYASEDPDRARIRAVALPLLDRLVPADLQAKSESFRQLVSQL